MVAVLFCLVFATNVLPIHGFTSGNASVLRNYLLSGYEASVRPQTTTYVSLNFFVSTLDDIDIKEETMSITGWWSLTWNDSRLMWDPAQYGSITDTHVYQKDIWTPPITIYNSVNNLSGFDEPTIPLRVTSSGLVSWTPPGILTVNCKTNIRHFPFDKQTCRLQVTTFGYSMTEVTIIPTGITTAFYNGHGEWTLLSTDNTTIVPSYYSFVWYTFEFQRKPTYYGMNLIFPVLMTWLLNILIFLLPPESGEKMSYSLTVLLAFVVLMTLVADKMPTTADHVSYLEIYISMVMSSCTFSVIYNVFNLRIYFLKKSEPIPRWLKRIILSTKTCCNRKSSRVQDSGVKSDAAEGLPAKTCCWDEESFKTSEHGSVCPLTWEQVAIEMDVLVLKIYVSVSTIATVVFLSLMVSG